MYIVYIMQPRSTYILQDNSGEAKILSASKRRLKISLKTQKYYYSLIEDSVLCFLLGMELGYFFMIFWAIQRLVGLEGKSLWSSYTKNAHWMSWNSCHSTHWFKQLKRNVAFGWITQFSLIHWSRQELELTWPSK